MIMRSLIIMIAIQNSKVNNNSISFYYHYYYLSGFVVISKQLEKGGN
jgi:hypothetical protein